MSQTCFFRVHSSPAGPQSGIGTMTFGHPQPVPAQGLHQRVHRVLRSAVLEQPRPGLFILAVHTALGEVGRLWLAATETPRAGTVGRHEAVDLALKQDAGLSLRHLLFVVRQVNGQVRFNALDLATPGGVHARVAVSAVETSSPMLLRSSGLLFFCVPTGPRATLAADPEQAWRQLDEPTGRQPPPLSVVERVRGHGAGVLTLQLGTTARTYRVEPQTLRDGVLLGRNERCDVLIPDRYTSRVHAIVISLDGVPYLIDTGSGNGTWHVGGVQAHCWRLEEGDAFRLGNATVQWWRVQ
jgi:hypothetical protein